MYRYLFGVKEIRVHKPACDCITFKGELDAHIKLPAHLGDALYVGEETLVEMAETWYRANRFIIRATAGGIGPPLDKDGWGLDLKPQELVRNMEVDVVLLYLVSLSMSRLAYFERQQQSVLAMIQELSVLHADARIDIVIHLADESSPPGDIVQPIVDVVGMLQHEKSNVEPYFKQIQRHRVKIDVNDWQLTFREARKAPREPQKCR